MIYVDKYFGVWRLLDDDDHHWELLSNNANHTLDDFQVGHCYNDASVRDLGPFKEIGTNKVYVFPHKYQQGDLVLIERTDLDKASLANTRIRDATYAVCIFEGNTSTPGLVKISTTYLVNVDKLID